MILQTSIPPVPHPNSPVQPGPFSQSDGFGSIRARIHVHRLWRAKQGRLRWAVRVCLEDHFHRLWRIFVAFFLFPKMHEPHNAIDLAIWPLEIKVST